MTEVIGFPNAKKEKSFDSAYLIRFFYSPSCCLPHESIHEVFIFTQKDGKLTSMMPNSAKIIEYYFRFLNNELATIRVPANDYER